MLLIQNKREKKPLKRNKQARKELYASEVSGLRPVKLLFSRALAIPAPPSMKKEHYILTDAFGYKKEKQTEKETSYKQTRLIGKTP